VTLTVEKRRLLGADMAVVTVLPSDMPPVRYDGRIWIRVGPRRVLASEQEERILIEKRRQNIHPYDIYPVRGATIDDLDEEFFQIVYLKRAFARDVLAANNRTYAERLASLNMIMSPDDTTPTVTGILTLGNNPVKFLNDDYIQWVRIDGTKLGDTVLDAKEITGKIYDMIDEQVKLFRTYNRHAENISEVTGLGVAEDDYPAWALEQILHNALLHRNYEHALSPVQVYWYNDRVEITSPGGPVGKVSVQNFGTPGLISYRNANLATAMRDMRIIQHFGQGIATSQEAMKRNGNRPIQFEVDSLYVKAVLYKKTDKTFGKAR
jgi:ATP-dependent DNA helicase RecG